MVSTSKARVDPGWIRFWALQRLFNRHNIKEARSKGERPSCPGPEKKVKKAKPRLHLFSNLFSFWNILPKYG
jgi:hypothetical protein